MRAPRLSLRTLALTLPGVFIVHVLEEGPRFVPWFNHLVTPDISQPLFLAVNAAALVITLGVALVVATTQEPAAGLFGAAWVGFLMLANGIFHIVGTLALGRYCPGVITATLLYLPVSFLFLRAVVRELRIPPLLAGAVALLGGVLMDIHGYLIVFRGSRLF